MSNFITEIKIKKVRHLENIDIKLGEEKRHLILTGKNGCGKTSVLEEMDRFFIKILQNNPNIEHIKPKDDIYIESKYDNLFIDFSGYNCYPIFKEKSLYLKNKNVDFIYSFFKAKRTLNPDRFTHIEKIVFPKDKTARLNNLLVRYLVSLKVERSFAKDDNEIEIVDNIDRWFDKFENILKQIFNDDNLILKFDRTNRRNYNFKILKKGREEFDFYTLSDGYSAIIDIVSELILKIENTESKSFDCEGIVLIDEIEAHLHIELQKNILPLLTNFFPNIQFIIATHSPFVLSSIENAVIYDLETHIRAEDLSEASYTGLVRKYFELPSEYSIILENKFEEFKSLAKKSDLSEEEEDRLIELDIDFKNISPLFSPELYSNYLNIRKEFLQ